MPLKTEARTERIDCKKEFSGIPFPVFA